MEGYGPNIVNAFMRLNLALKEAGIPKPVAIVFPAGLAKNLLVQTVSNSIRPGVTYGSSVMETYIHDIEVRSESK